MSKGHCKQCGGTGALFLLPKSTQIDFVECDLCDGTGIDTLNKAYVLQGMVIRAFRIQNEISLREFAKKVGIDPSNLSKMERGKTKPPAELVNMAWKNFKQEEK